MLGTTPRTYLFTQEVRRAISSLLVSCDNSYWDSHTALHPLQHNHNTIKLAVRNGALGAFLGACHSSSWNHDSVGI